MKPQLTPAQIEALRRIIAQWDEARDFSMRRWGTEKQGGVQVITGTDPRAITRNLRTLLVLEDEGLIVIERQKNHSVVVDSAAFGRRIVGSHRVPYTSKYVTPTVFGRAAAKRG